MCVCMYDMLIANFFVFRTLPHIPLMYVRVYVCMYVCMCVCMCLCVCMCVYVCVFMYTENNVHSVMRHVLSCLRTICVH